jgi:hypothetical protein
MLDQSPTKVIGFINIPEDNLTVYFLVDDAGNSGIGYVVHKDKSCIELEKVNTDCGCHDTKLTTEIVDLTVIDEEQECEKRKCFYYTVEHSGDPSCTYFEFTQFLDCNGVLQYGSVYQIDDPSSNHWRQITFAAIQGSVVAGPCATITEGAFAGDVEIDCTDEPITFPRSNCCTYKEVYNDTVGCKLNFDIHYPIRAAYKKNQCETIIYFGARNIPPRKITLYNPRNSGDCGEPYSEFDCNKARIFPEYCHPDIKAIDIDNAGQLMAGSYQFTMAYASSNGFEYTDYFDVTQPVPIFERFITDVTAYPTSKAIGVKIKHNTEIFSHFNLVAVQTLDLTTTYHLVGTYKVPASGVSNINVTGKFKSEFDSVKALARTPFYETTNIIKTNGEVLMLGDLEGDLQYNFQPIANTLKLFWETVELTEGVNDYANPIIAANFKGYDRDEVYPFGIRYKLKNGKYTCVYPIANREPDANDLFPYLPDDKDHFYKVDECTTDTAPIPKWKIYNTAGTGTPVNIDAEEYCGVQNHLRGEFAYYESTETYPCNHAIWGSLAGQPMRFHKFPDSLITHIHNNQGKIYPIGVRMDPISTQDMLNLEVNHPVTAQPVKMKDLICGWQLVRGNRVNNKSVIAKGLYYDVGVYQPTDEDGNVDSDDTKWRYYPNYPFNDRREDPFIATNSSIYNYPDVSTRFPEKVKHLNGFDSTIPEDVIGRRYTFHSPNTHFFQPTLGDEMKIETEEFGLSHGHYTSVLDHPKYKFLTRFDYFLFTALGIAGGLSGTQETTVVGGFTAKVDLGAALATFNVVRDLFETSIPLRNFALSHHAVGHYDDFVAVPNSGFKRRPLDIKAYLAPIIQDVLDSHPIHNYHRESSVYLRSALDYQPFGPYTHFDQSRWLLSDYDCRNPEEVIKREINSWYGSIKRTVPNQYGQIETIEYLDTGDEHTFEVIGGAATYIVNKYPSFGGDTFINKFALKRKHTFFNQNMVGRPDQIDFDYQRVPNLGYPIYYIGTSPDELSLGEILSPSIVGLFLTGLILAATANGPLNAGEIIATAAATNLLANVLKGFIPQNNLDCDMTPVFEAVSLADLFQPGGIDTIQDNLDRLFERGNTIFYQSGKFYLNNIGIANFYVESDINTQMRHGRNILEENFYPNVGHDIPDNWLQEKTVPIARDNTYLYNKTYSKQAFENFRCNYTKDMLDGICTTYYPNRVIYSDGSNQEEIFDAWTVYKTNNYYDFPKTNGKLIALDVVENEKVYARFENTMEIYNSTISLTNDSPYIIELGNNSMFRNKPIDTIKSDVGYLGTQHQAFLSTKYGAFWLDAKRGKVYQFGQGLKEISNNDTYNWFRNNLPFKIKVQFPDVNVDNAFHSFGVAMGWDNKFERVFITKRDWSLKEEFVPRVTTRDGLLYLDGDFEITPDNSGHMFDNHSWTISYSPITEGWISFHSFLPKYYISQVSHLESGTGTNVWKHNMHSLTYQTYYNDFHPYILEYTIPSGPITQTINSVCILQDILEYINDYDYYSLMTKNSRNYDVNFTKCVIYNQEQSTGMMRITEQPLNNLKAKFEYPKYTGTGMDILMSKREGKCYINTIYDNVSNQNNGQPLFTTDSNDLLSDFPIDKIVNPRAMDYTRSYNKKKLRSTQCRIRLIQDEYNRYKFINHFQSTQVNV